MDMKNSNPIKTTQICKKFCDNYGFALQESRALCVCVYVVCVCVCVGIRFRLKLPDCKASSCALFDLGQRAGNNHNRGSGRLRGSDEGSAQGQTFLGHQEWRASLLYVFDKFREDKLNVHDRAANLNLQPCGSTFRNVKFHVSIATIGFTCR